MAVSDGKICTCRRPENGCPGRSGYPFQQYWNTQTWNDWSGLMLTFHWPELGWTQCPPCMNMCVDRHLCASIPACTAFKTRSSSCPPVCTGLRKAGTSLRCFPCIKPLGRWSLDLYVFAGCLAFHWFLTRTTGTPLQQTALKPVAATGWRTSSSVTGDKKAD